MSYSDDLIFLYAAAHSTWIQGIKFLRCPSLCAYVGVCIFRLRHSAASAELIYVIRSARGGLRLQERANIKFLN